MDVAVVCHSTVGGGAERYLCELYRRLADHDVSGRLVGAIPGWDSTGLAATAVDFGPKWGRATIAAGVARLPRERRLVARAMDVGPVDIVHAQFKREQIGLAAVLARRGPVVWTEHGRLGRGPFDRLLAMAYRQASRHVAHIICVSEAVADDVSEATGSRVPVTVIPTMVDTAVHHVGTDEERRRARIRFGVHDDRQVVVWAGRIDPGKRPLLAIEAMRSVPGADLLMAGYGDLAGSAADLASTVPNVRLVGRLGADDMVELYRAADSLLFTSTGPEGLPITVVEAAAYGLPIVACLPEEDHRSFAASGSLHVEAPEPGAVADAVRSALDSGRSAQALAWARSHDVAHWRDAHLRVLRDLA